MHFFENISVPISGENASYACHFRYQLDTLILIPQRRNHSKARGFGLLA